MARRPRSEMIDIIRGIPLFSGLSKAELREVAKLCFERSYEAGDVILKQREDGQLMVAILSGWARISRDGTDITTVTAGDAVGEMALIDGHRRSASVIAETPLEGIIIYRTTFMKLLNSNPSITRKILLAQTARLREADKKLGAIG